MESLEEKLRLLVSEEFQPTDNPLSPDDPESSYKKIEALCLARLQDTGIEEIIGSLKNAIATAAPKNASGIHKQVLVGHLRANLELAQK